MPTLLSNEEVLNSRIEEYDCTVREFFKDCMVELWSEGEGFSGKRPGNYGDSDWFWQVCTAFGYEHESEENNWKGRFTVWSQEEIEEMVESALKSL